MLETIHRLQRGFFFYIFLAILAASMLFFGTDFSAPPEPYAIKIGDDQISYDEFTEQRRELQNYMLKQFGPQYFSFLMESGKLNLNQQVIDSIIPAFLVQRFAKQSDMFVSDVELQQHILSQFGSTQGYRGFLSQSGQSAMRYERQLREQLLSNQIAGFVEDFSSSSLVEARNMIRRQETEYDIQFVRYTNDDFLAAIADPDEETVKAFYDAEASTFEQPAKVAYSYVVFSPEKAEKEVEVLDEDIEFYYSDNQTDFVTEPRADVRHIQLNFPVNPTPEQMVETKERAEEVLAKATAGEDFEALVSQYSDDITTNTRGGSLGTLTEKSPQKEIAKAALDLESEGLTELIEKDYGYHVVKVDSYTKGGIRPLEAVKEEIISRIKKTNAPAYASTIAQESFDSWNDSDQDLAAFAKEHNFEIQESALAGASEDPQANLRTLTQQVLNFPEEKRQLVELSNVSVLVEIKDYKEPHIPELAAIKDTVISVYKKKEAAAMATEKEAEFIATAKEKGELTAVASAIEASKTPEEKTALKRSGKLSDFLTDAEIQKAVFNQTEKGVLDRIYEYNNAYYLIQVTDVRPPDESLISEKEKQALQQKRMQNTAFAMKSIVDQLKVRAEISIQPGLIQ